MTLLLYPYVIFSSSSQQYSRRNSPLISLPHLCSGSSFNLLSAQISMASAPPVARHAKTIFYSFIHLANKSLLSPFDSGVRRLYMVTTSWLQRLNKQLAPPGSSLVLRRPQGTRHFLHTGHPWVTWLPIIKAAPLHVRIFKLNPLSQSFFLVWVL